MVILELIFSLFILSLPSAEVIRFQYSNGVAISLNDIFLGILVFYWLIYRIKNKKFNLRNDRLMKPIFVFPAIGLIALVFNFTDLKLSEFFVSFLYLLRWVMYALIYFIVRDFGKKFKEKVPYLLFVSGSIIVFGGYIQYFLYPNLRNLYYLGWDEHLYRMFSSFLDPNFAGAFFVLFFMLTVGLVYSFLKKKAFIKSFVFSVMGLLTFIAVYLTYSRSALITLIIATAVFLFIIGRRRVIALSVIGLLLIVFLLPRSFQTEGTNFLRVASGEARIQSLQLGFNIFAKNPVLGVGFDAYRYAQNRYGIISGQDWQTTHSGAGTDNSFLFVLATTGVIGFTAFIYLLFFLFKYAKENFKTNMLSVVLFSSLAGLIFDSFFINSLFYVFIMEWVWVLLGLIESK